jgi:hypothetical protein
MIGRSVRNALVLVMGMGVLGFGGPSPAGMDPSKERGVAQVESPTGGVSWICLAIWLGGGVHDNTGVMLGLSGVYWYLNGC